MFFEQFEQLCKENGTSPTILLKKLGYSTSKYTAWKNGSIPNLEIAYKIAKYFNVTLDFLSTGENKQPNDIKIVKIYNKLNQNNKIKVEGYAEGLLQEQQELADNTKIS